MKRFLKKGMIIGMAALLLAAGQPAPVRAAMVDTSENSIIISKNISKGKIGRSMNVNFQIVNQSGQDWEDVEVNIYNSSGYIASPDALETEYIFPFEVTTATFEPRHVGTVKAGKTKNVSIPVRVRGDLKGGYYAVEIEVRSKDNKATTTEYVNIWLETPVSGDDDDDDENLEVGFTLGENQGTPFGVYPNVMDFAINMRNSGLSDARDVTVSMKLSKDTNEFPFDINDGNYNRNFEAIAAGETVQLPYSMAIRSDAYSGYYPLTFTITYRETATGDLKSEEDTFWVHIQNKEEEDEAGDFNENDRTKARIIVDSFETVPASIIAGEPFELVLRMKNASSDIPASNILFSMESEKVSDSAVFTTASGSSSVVVNSLAAGEVTELRIQMLSKAGIDQRSYALTIKETYDSPEFKNASESVSIDIPIRQVARLNTGTIEVMPESINVGSETNVMFPINNTGKVILYNVMASFEADSIVPAEAYVGNIKPGETGNVDVMLTGAAATMDDGKVTIRITYEDENGDLQEPVEKELTLYVTEPMPEDFDMPADIMDVPVEEPSFFETYGPWIGLGGAAAAAAVLAAVLRYRKKKKEAQQEEDDTDDEIS